MVSCVLFETNQQQKSLAATSVPGISKIDLRSCSLIKSNRSSVLSVDSALLKKGGGTNCTAIVMKSRHVIVILFLEW
jgi:hypothetical protein